MKLVLSTELFVSILVLLDFVLKAPTKHEKNALDIEFQSLFYWILFLRKPFLVTVSNSPFSFNPCFIGFCS